MAKPWSSWTHSVWLAPVPLSPLDPPLTWLWSLTKLVAQPSPSWLELAVAASMYAWPTGAKAFTSASCIRYWVPSLVFGLRAVPVTRTL
jgi:hypothetical protein